MTENIFTSMSIPALKYQMKLNSNELVKLDKQIMALQQLVASFARQYTMAEIAYHTKTEGVTKCLEKKEPKKQKILFKNAETPQSKEDTKLTKDIEKGLGKLSSGKRKEIMKLLNL